MNTQNKLGPPKKCWYCTHLGGCLKEDGPCEKFEKHTYSQVPNTTRYDRINTLRYDDVGLLIHINRRYVTTLINTGRVKEILHKLKLATGAEYAYYPDRSEIRFERVNTLDATTVNKMIENGELDKLYSTPDTSLSLLEVCKLLDIPYTTTVDHVNKQGQQCVNKIIAELYKKTGKHYIYDTEISRKKFILKGE